MEVPSQTKVYNFEYVHAELEFAARQSMIQIRIVNFKNEIQIVNSHSHWAPESGQEMDYQRFVKNVGIKLKVQLLLCVLCEDMEPPVNLTPSPLHLHGSLSAKPLWQCTYLLWTTSGKIRIGSVRKCQTNL